MYQYLSMKQIEENSILKLTKYLEQQQYDTDSVQLDADVDDSNGNIAHNTNDNKLVQGIMDFIISILELLKLRFETSVLLDRLDVKGGIEGYANTFKVLLPCSVFFQFSFSRALAKK